MVVVKRSSPSGWSSEWMAINVVMALPISTTNMTGFLTSLSGFSIARAWREAARITFGSRSIFSSSKPRFVLNHFLSLSSPGSETENSHGRKTIQYRREREGGDNWPDGQSRSGAEKMEPGPSKTKREPLRTPGEDVRGRVGETRPSGCQAFWGGEQAASGKRSEGRTISGGPPGRLVPARGGTCRPESS